MTILLTLGTALFLAWVLLTWWLLLSLHRGENSPARRRVENLALMLWCLCLAGFALAFGTAVGMEIWSMGKGHP